MSKTTTKFCHEVRERALWLILENEGALTPDNSSI